MKNWYSNGVIKLGNERKYIYIVGARLCRAADFTYTCVLF